MMFEKNVASCVSRRNIVWLELYNLTRHGIGAGEGPTTESSVDLGQEFPPDHLYILQTTELPALIPVEHR